MAFFDTLTSTLGQVNGILGPINTLKQSFEGRRQAQRGSQLKAAGFRQSGASAVAAAEFNNQIAEIDLNRNLDALSRQLRRISSAQVTQAAASGIDVSSPSLLAVMNETIGQFEREVVDRRIATQNIQRAELFGAQVRQAEAENEARAEEFQAAQTRRTQVPSLISQGVNVFKGVGEGLTGLGTLLSPKEAE